MSSIAGSVAPSTVAEVPIFKSSDYDLNPRDFIRQLLMSYPGWSGFELHRVKSDQALFKKLFLDGFENFTSHFGGQNVLDYLIYEVDDRLARIRIFQAGDGTLVYIGIYKSSREKVANVLFRSSEIGKLPFSVISLLDPESIRKYKKTFAKVFDEKGNILEKIKRNEFVKFEKEESESNLSTPVQSPLELPVPQISDFDPFKSVLDVSRQQTIQKTETRSRLDSLAEIYAEEHAKQQIVPESSQTPVLGQPFVFGEQRKTEKSKPEKGWLSNLVQPTSVQPLVEEDDDGYSTAREPDEPKIKKDEKGKGKEVRFEQKDDSLTTPISDTDAEQEKLEKLEDQKNIDPIEAEISSLYRELDRLEEKIEVRRKAVSEPFYMLRSLFSLPTTTTRQFREDQELVENRNRIVREIARRKFPPVIITPNVETKEVPPVATSSKVKTEQLPVKSDDNQKDSILESQIWNPFSSFSSSLEGLYQLPTTIVGYFKIFLIIFFVITGLGILAFIMNFITFIRDLFPSRGRRR